MANVYTKMGSYPEQDVTFLLKDLSSIEMEKSTEERERSIQSGAHYSEMLPIEYKPTASYMDLFYQSLEESKQKVAEAVAVVAEQIVKSEVFKPFCAAWHGLGHQSGCSLNGISERRMVSICRIIASLLFVTVE